jgi:hypothetical protein
VRTRLRSLCACHFGQDKHPERHRLPHDAREPDLTSVYDCLEPSDGLMGCGLVAAGPRHRTDRRRPAGDLRAIRP